jgi:hypothetical protein
VVIVIALLMGGIVNFSLKAFGVHL